MFTLNLKGACPMSPLVYRMNAVLSRVVHRVPVGTNLGLFHCLWMLLSGRLLAHTGRADRDERNRFTAPPAPADQRAVGDRRSAGLRSRVSPPAAPDRRHPTLCRARTHQLHGAPGCPPRLSREGAETHPRRAGPPPPAHLQGAHYCRDTPGPP